MTSVITMRCKVDSAMGWPSEVGYVILGMVPARFARSLLEVGSWRLSRAESALPQPLQLRFHSSDLLFGSLPGGSLCLPGRFGPLAPQVPLSGDGIPQP